MLRKYILPSCLFLLLWSGVASAQQATQPSALVAPSDHVGAEATRPGANAATANHAVSLPDYFFRHLTGTIGGKDRIVMNITRVGKHVVGDYYDANRGIPFFFGYDSVISNDGEVHLVARDQLGEKSANEVTGVFDGRFVGKNEVRGTWKGSDSSSTLPFALSTVGVTEGSFDVQHDERGYYDRTHGSAKIDFTYPVMRTRSAETDAAFNANVVSTVVGLYENGVNAIPPTSIAEAMSDFIQSFTAQLGDETPRTYFPPWTYTITGQILFDSAGIVSMRYEAFSFEGGAHPDTVYTNSSYVRSTGSVISLDDLLKPGYRKKLNAIGLSEFRREHGIKPGESLSDAGYFVTDNTFQLNDNFLITQAGLVFQFNQYEIAPYYFGAQQVLIPFSDLSALLLPNSPIESLLSQPGH